MPASTIASTATRLVTSQISAGVVLHPAGPREMLAELAVAAARDPPLAVEDKAGRAGRPLIDRENHARRLSTGALQPVDAREVPELAGAVEEAAEALARRAVLEVQLDLADLQARRTTSTVIPISMP